MVLVLKWNRGEQNSPKPHRERERQGGEERWLTAEERFNEGDSEEARVEVEVEGEEAGGGAAGKERSLEEEDGRWKKPMLVAPPFSIPRRSTAKKDKGGRQGRQTGRQGRQAREAGKGEGKR